MEKKCRRCSKCCQYIKNGRTLDCPYLFRDISLGNSCEVYDDRLGKFIDRVDGNPIVCVSRDKTSHDYIGCPYNTNKPILR